MSKGSSPAPSTKRPHEVKVDKKYTITFSEIPPRVYGNLRLIYFSETEDKVQSVLGISDPFPVRKKENSGGF